MSDNETSNRQIFKVIFHNQGKVYEIYAQNVDHGIMFGFIEVEELIFGEKTSIVVDPTEETLKNEFEGVKRTYIPLHSIIRIDEVIKEGAAKITESAEKGSNVMPFPVYTKSGDSE